MHTVELIGEIDLLPQESYSKVENFVKQLIASDQFTEKEGAFRTFMDKMNLVEKLVQGNGCYSEEDVEKELDKI